MEISDLKPADILLFSGEKGSWISEAIMFLTDSSVSHAAMTYTSSEKIVEESPPAVQVNDAAQRFKGRTVYVMRIDPSKDSMSPVLDASEGYLNKDEPYAMSNLYLVGLLLLYRKFTPSTQVQKVMLKIFKKLAADIIKYINKHKNPGKLNQRSGVVSKAHDKRNAISGSSYGPISFVKRPVRTRKSHGVVGRLCYFDYSYLFYIDTV